MENTKRIKDAIVRDYPDINLEANLTSAINRMARNNASALVVREDDQLLGIVTITDVMFSLSGSNNPDETRISSFMTTCELISEEGTRNPCVQLDSEQDALSAIKVMYEAGVNHLVVSGKAGEPVGIVSSLEIVKLLAES
jgi:CBS domain-containing protein